MNLFFLVPQTQAEVLEVESLPEASLRDMSTWKVTVPYVTTKQDSNSKPYPVFNINVTNIVMGGI